MAQPSTISEAIEQNAKGPASVSVAGQSVTAKDVSQQIEADRYLAQKRAAANGSLGIRIGRVIPGGTG